MTLRSPLGVGVVAPAISTSWQALFAVVVQRRLRVGRQAVSSNIAATHDSVCAAVGVVRAKHLDLAGVENEATAALWEEVWFTLADDRSTRPVAERATEGGPACSPGLERIIVTIELMQQYSAKGVARAWLTA